MRKNRIAMTGMSDPERYAAAWRDRRLRFIACGRELFALFIHCRHGCLPGGPASSPIRARQIDARIPGLVDPATWSSACGSIDIGAFAAGTFSLWT
jgi:hypothetical protein